MAAVGKFVLWGKENLCLVRARDGALLLETLFFAEDVRSKKEIEEVVEATAVAEAELQLAGQVISSLSGEWSPEDLANDYREDLKQMLEAKLAGHEIVAPEPVAEMPVIDLMEALRQSVVDAQGRRAKSGSENGKAAHQSSRPGTGGLAAGASSQKSGSRSRKAPAR